MSGGLNWKWLIFFGLLCGRGTMAEDRFDLVIVSLADENKVAVYELDKKLGAIRLISQTGVNGDAGSQYYDPEHGVLYLGLRNAGKIAILRLHRDSKRLSQVDELDVDKDPAYMSLGRSRKWLFVAYYATGRVSCFPVNELGKFRRDKQGKVVDQGKQWLSTAPRAHAILADSSNRFVFVPHTGPNSIFQFRFDAKRGHLLPNQAPQVRFPENTGPRHVVFHPHRTSQWFCINEKGSSVTGMELDTVKGTLQLGQTVATIPKDYRGPNACADLEITGDGKFLYAANRGHDSICCFKVLSNGKLVQLGIIETEKTPRQFGISPDSRFLVAAGQGANKMAVFRIQADTGLLKRVSTVATGKKPWWVTIAE